MALQVSQRSGNAVRPGYAWQASEKRSAKEERGPHRKLCGSCRGECKQAVRSDTCAVTLSGHAAARSRRQKRRKARGLRHAPAPRCGLRRVAGCAGASPAAAPLPRACSCAVRVQAHFCLPPAAPQSLPRACSCAAALSAAHSLQMCASRSPGDVDLDA